MCFVKVVVIVVALIQLENGTLQEDESCMAYLNASFSLLIYSLGLFSLLFSY